LIRINLCATAECYQLKAFLHLETTMKMVRSLVVFLIVGLLSVAPVGVAQAIDAHHPGQSAAKKPSKATVKKTAKPKAAKPRASGRPSSQILSSERRPS
jgi:hypothetical protein